MPDFIGLTGAGLHDRKAYEQLLPALATYDVFADKAYQREGKTLLK